VEQITFELRAPVQGESGPGVVLTAEESGEFLRLLAESRRFSPNHPKGGWTHFARVETREKDYYLPIHASVNNGTLVWLHSRGTDGWNYGTLRNDELKSFVERVFARGAGTNDLLAIPPRGI
jgi:hypothetical protein